MFVPSYNADAHAHSSISIAQFMNLFVLTNTSSHYDLQHVSERKKKKLDSIQRQEVMEWLLPIIIELTNIQCLMCTLLFFSINLSVQISKSSGSMQKCAVGKSVFTAKPKVFFFVFF